MDQLTTDGADQPVVTNPDSSTHFTCASTPGQVDTHHIVNGACRYCEVTDSALRERYGLS